MILLNWMVIATEVSEGVMMPAVIDRSEVRRLMEENALLIEVLPAVDYDAEHITGAINLPIKEINAQTTPTSTSTTR